MQQLSSKICQLYSEKVGLDKWMLFNIFDYQVIDNSVLSIFAETIIKHIINYKM